MTTRYLIDAVMLALPEGQHALSALEITQLCRGDSPALERRKLTSTHGTRSTAAAGLKAIRDKPRCVMAAMIEWQGPGAPTLDEPGTLHVPGDPQISVVELWERPYKATLSRYSAQPGITVTMAPWQAGESDVLRWPVGGGEWPKWTRPAYPG